MNQEMAEERIFQDLNHRFLKLNVRRPYGIPDENPGFGKKAFLCGKMCTYKDLDEFQWKVPSRDQLVNKKLLV